MFIAMNRFRIVPGHEDAFIEIWRDRDSRLKEMEGFVSFALLRGAAQDDHTLFSSHTVWQNRAAFEAWTTSEQFREAHRNAGGHGDLYLGPPQFEGFEVVSGTAETVPA